MPKSFAIASRIGHRLALALPMLASLAGCAPTSAPEEARAQAAVAPVQPEIHAELQETQTCRPDSALLLPQSAPDCVFGRPDLKTLDPDRWARLKVEYERQCYQRAEKVVRDRLRQLQAASKCENAPVLR